MYQAKNISYRVAGKVVLENVSLAIKPGRLTAVVGPNGGGKSTLLKVISGELMKKKGDVLLNNHFVNQLTIKELSQTRAVLPQFSVLNFPFTAEDVVLMGRFSYKSNYGDNLKIIGEIMKELGISHLKTRIFNTLSGGEKQRVQLARVIAQITGNDNSPKYLLLDEPTSSLDIACQHQIFHHVKRLCRKNVGVLAIVHDLNLAAQYADDIFFLKEGKEIFYGDTRKAFRKEIIEETFHYPVIVKYDTDTETPYMIALPLEPKSTIHKGFHHKNGKAKQLAQNFQDRISDNKNGNAFPEENQFLPFFNNKSMF